MILSYDDLVGAVTKVKNIASDAKLAPAVLLNFESNILSVCYSDGKNNIIEKIEGELEETDKDIQIVVKMDKMQEILDLCAPGTNLKTAPLKLTIDGVDGFTVDTRKFYEYDAGDGDIQQRDTSTISKTVKYQKADEELRYQLLSRMNYASIFESESWDSWDASYLRGLIQKVSKNDAKVCYISAKSKSSFAINGDKTSLTYADVTEGETFQLTHGFTVSGKVAKYLGDILNKIQDKTVMISTLDTRYCKLITDDNKLGIQFEMAPASKFDKVTLDRYRNTEYNGYQVVFNRYALLDFIKGVISSDKEDDAILKFSLSEDGLSLETKRGSLTTSKAGLSILSEGYTDNLGDIDSKEFTLNFKILNTLVNNCTELFVVMDLVPMPSGIIIRLSDSCGKDTEGNIIANTYHYMAAK